MGEIGQLQTLGKYGQDQPPAAGLAAIVGAELSCDAQIFELCNGAVHHDIIGDQNRQTIHRAGQTADLQCEGIKISSMIAVGVNRCPCGIADQKNVIGQLFHVFHLFKCCCQSIFSKRRSYECRIKLKVDSEIGYCQLGMNIAWGFANTGLGVMG